VCDSERRAANISSSPSFTVTLKVCILLNIPILPSPPRNSMTKRKIRGFRLKPWISGLRERFPGFRERFPGVRERIPEVREWIPAFREPFPDLSKWFPGIRECSPERRERFPEVGRRFTGLRNPVPDVGESFPDPVRRGCLDKRFQGSHRSQTRHRAHYRTVRSGGKLSLK